MGPARASQVGVAYFLFLDTDMVRDGEREMPMLAADQERDAGGVRPDLPARARRSTSRWQRSSAAAAGRLPEVVLEGVSRSGSSSPRRRPTRRTRPRGRGSRRVGAGRGRARRERRVSSGANAGPRGALGPVEPLAARAPAPDHPFRLPGASPHGARTGRPPSRHASRGPAQSRDGPPPGPQPPPGRRVRRRSRLAAARRSQTSARRRPPA